MSKKKVLCLYRVSTKMQVNRETDDIPMQKAECEKFIARHPDWEWYDEIAEKGISGFKHTSRDRDALNEIMERAGRREFDILLVYMSDRLGRREDDTPFYVAGLNNLGIEVWSVNENQLKTEEHIDKLINYIRFWNAEGESLKTSVRVRDAQLEMIRRGEYTGGGCPYGYNQVYSGKYNNKGRALKRLEINPEQARTVRRIFELSTNSDMGGYRIARILNGENIPAKKGGKWTLCTVNNILRNPIYKGYYCYGRGKVKGRRGRTSPDEWICSPVRHPELAIVEEAFWDKAQRVREARTPARGEKKNVTCGDCPSHAGGGLLLMGLAYCGYCGSRLSNGTAYDKWTTKDGQKHKKVRRQYKCMDKAQGNSACPGRFTYKQEPLEEAVLELVENCIGCFGEDNVEEQLRRERQAREQEEEREVQLLGQKIHSLEKDIDTLKAQLPRAIREEFVLSLPELQELIEGEKEKLEEAKAELSGRQREFSARALRRAGLDGENGIVPKQEVFRELSVPEKRLVLSAIINRVEVKEGSLRIEAKVELENFLPPITDSGVSTSH